MARLPLLALVALLTAPAATPARAQEGVAVRLDSAEWRVLNVFFSNFAEARVSPFRRGEVPAGTLAQFGVMHHVVNLSRRIELAPGRNGYARLRASHVAAAVRTYFGLHFADHQAPGGDFEAIEYARGYYLFPVADYEAHPFAQVRRLRDLGGGEFVADVGTYISLEVGEDAYATPVESMRMSGYEVYDVAEMQARVRRLREGGRERYVLLEWLPAP